MSREYAPALDGLRAVAVLLVLAFHTYLIGCGWIGVQIFFVLSGYLITTGLLETSREPLGRYVGRFYARRALRIFPLYYGYLLVVAALALRFELPGDILGSFPYLATYTFNLTRLTEGWQGSIFYTHFWSLCIEEHFYLVWPLLLYGLSPRGRRVLVAALLVTAPIVRWALGAWAAAAGHGAYVTGDFVYWFSLSHFDAFAAGGAIAIFGLVGRIRRPGMVAVALAATTLVCGWLNLTALRGAGVPLTATSLGFPLAGTANLQHVWGYTLINVSAAALVLWLVSGAGAPGLLRRLLSHPAPVAVGRVSYGMYVFHWPVLWGLQLLLRKLGVAGSLVQSPAFFPVYAAVVFALAYASYTLYERRFLEMKERYFAS